MSREGYVTGHPGNDGRYDGDITSGAVFFEVAVARFDVSFGYDLPAFRDEGETGFLDGFLNEILFEPLAGVNMFDAAFEGLVEFLSGKAGEMERLGAFGINGDVGVVVAGTRRLLAEDGKDDFIRDLFVAADSRLVFDEGCLIESFAGPEWQTAAVHDIEALFERQFRVNVRLREDEGPLVLTFPDVSSEHDERVIGFHIVFD